MEPKSIKLGEIVHPKDFREETWPKRLRVSRRADERDVAGFQDRIHGVDAFPDMRSLP